MDRSVLESDPHRVLEGMAIAAYAVGASDGLRVLPRRVPARGRRVCARRSATPRRAGYLGRVDHGHQVLVRGRRPARRRRVRLRRGDRADRVDRGRARDAASRARRIPAVAGSVGPPDAHQQRRDASPTSHRSSATAATGSPRIGTATSKGTKVFALAGRVVNTGLVEVPMGTTLREIVFDIGGGIVDGRAVQGRPDRRPGRRLHPRRVPRHAGRLRVAHRGRVVHGLGRDDRHGRHSLHGQRREVLHGLLPRGVVRQVRPVPGRARPSCGCCSIGSRSGEATIDDLAQMERLAGDGPADEPVRPRPGRPEPDLQHAALLPRRVPRPHRRPGLPGRACARSSTQAVPA